jgi:aspartyl-tRNA(Asn)/glutamyl-tRNA(Gln) amidotransferase subunit A
VLAVAADAIRAFTDVACIDEISPALDDPFESVRVLLAAGSAGAHGDAFAEVRDELDPDSLETVEEGFRLTADRVGAALVGRARWVETMRALMEPYDLLVTPATPVPAFEVGREGPATVAGRERPGLSWAAFSYPFNLTGQPAASVPCGFVDGLPVGLQLIGRWRDDATVLRAAAAFEHARPWAHRWPELVPATQASREERIT